MAQYTELPEAIIEAREENKNDSWGGPENGESAISNSGGGVSSEKSHDRATKASTVKEISPKPENRNENEVPQSLAILELSVIDNAKSRFPPNENIARPNEAALSKSKMQIT